jgi:uncharacterized protein
MANGYEWDARKAAINLDKHEVDFEHAARIFAGPVLERPDRRRRYGEARLIAFGEVGGEVLAVVYTRRGANRRIISARKARRDERQAYRQAREP